MKFKGFLRELELGLDVSNIFGARVATSGWVYSAIYATGGHPDGNRYYQIGFIPTAGTTAIGSVTLRF
jgi:iron complex outermembrane receptor protein